MQVRRVSERLTKKTGLQVVIKRLIGVYTTPHELIVYQDGNKIQLVALCFEAAVVGGELRLSCETTGYGYFFLPRNTSIGHAFEPRATDQRCLQWRKQRLSSE